MIQTPNLLQWLNSGTDAALLELQCCAKVMTSFIDNDLIALVVGSAYGGGVESLAKLWYERGKVYGYDTFEGHPRDLSDDPASHEAICMDMWYNNPDFGKAKLDYDYQKNILENEGLHNAFLVKGRIHPHSFDDIPYAHYVILDMDLIKPTRTAYEVLENKIKPGGFLFFHDALPENHMPLIHQFVYNEVIPTDKWFIEKEVAKSYTTILKRK